MRAITVRRLELELPPVLDPIVIPGEPERSFDVVAFSLVLPYVEPYLIRTMKAARARVDDPVLRDEMDLFTGQEAQHYRQHARLNEAIRAFGVPGLAPIEAALDADYRGFSGRRSLEWNLAYAEGFEAFTTAMALATFADGIDARMHGAVADLLRWHLIEELEHRTVAFDVYQRVCGSYPYRVAVGAFAQWHLQAFVRRAASHLWQSDPRMQSEYGGVAGRRRRVRGRLMRRLRGLLPRVLRTYAPGYTPHAIAFDAEMVALADAYTQRTAATPR